MPVVTTVTADTAALRVTVDNDWLAYVDAGSGLLGAALAAFAVWYASKQAATARRDLVRERRLSHELSLLADLSRQWHVTYSPGHVAGHIAALVRDPTDETDLPLLRKVAGVHPGPRGQAAEDAVRAATPPQSSFVSRMQEEVGLEIRQAIARRMD